MPRLDPKHDFVFKQLLTRERVLLGDMLEGVLGRPVGVPTIVDAAIPGDRKDGKRIELDVHAVLADGSRASVEMQLRTSRTLASRLFYYGARNHSGQLHRGEDYERLTPTAVIAWVVEPLFPKLERLHSIVQPREIHTNTLFSDHFSIHLLQLSKPPVRSPFRLPCYDAKVERWARFFNARCDAELDRLAAEDPIMRHATQILDDISQNFDAYFHARRIADAIAFDKLERAAWREEGEAKGRAEILLKQLGHRFGPLSNAARARIEAGTVAELDTWAERVLTAGSLEEVLAS